MIVKIETPQYSPSKLTLSAKNLRNVKFRDRFWGKYSLVLNLKLIVMGCVSFWTVDFLKNLSFFSSSAFLQVEISLNLHLFAGLQE